MSVGPDQHGVRSSDRAKHRKLPWTSTSRLDQPDPIRPWGDVEAASRTEVEQDRPGIVQQREHAQRTTCGNEVEIGHATPEQRMSLAEVVANIQTGDHRGEPLARLVHSEELG